MRIIRYLALLLMSFAVLPNVSAAPPVIIASPSPLSGCAALHVAFNNTTVATSHFWDFGSLGQSYIPSPGLIILTPGTYPVKYTATDASGSSTKSWTIVVHPTPVVDFTASPTIGCQDLQVQFTDASNPGSSSGNTYAWVLAGSGNSNKNPQYTFTACGVYNATLTVTNQFGCAATVTKSNLITVQCKPNVSFAASPTTHCLVPGITQYTSNFSSIITGAVPPYSYLWNFNNSSVPPLTTQANPANVPFTFTGPATYNTSLKVTDANGCVGELNKADYIKSENIKANFTISPTSACVFSPVTVTSTSTTSGTSTISSSWVWGDLTPASQGSPATHSYETPGTKKIKLTATNLAGCLDTVSKSITIYPQPVIDMSFTPLKPCPAPQVLNFIATGASTYAWDFGSTPTGTGTTPSHLYANNGFYTVSLVGTDMNGCKDTMKYLDTVKIYDAYLRVYADTPGGCVNDTVCFSSKILTTTPGPDTTLYPYSVVKYHWDFGDGDTSNLPSPCHIFRKIQKSNVVLTVTTENGCIFKDSTEVIHDTLPKAGFFITPTHICNRKFVFGYDTSTKYPTDTSQTLINEWRWYLIPAGGLPSLTLTSIAQNPVFFIEYPDIYNVIFYAAKYYCWDSVRVDSVIKVDLPRADFNHVVSCDTPTRVHFTNLSYGYYGISNPSYKWYFGDAANTTSTALNPSFTYPALGSYTVMLVAFNDTLHCSDTIRTIINLQTPTLHFQASDTTICPTETVNFTSNVTNGNIKEYYWFVNNGLKSFLPAFQNKFLNKGFYTVMLITRDINNCFDTLTKPDYIVTSTPTVDFTNPTIGCNPFTVNFTDNSTRFPNTPLAALASRYWDFGNGNTTTTNASINQTYTVNGHYDVKLVVTDINGCKDSLTKIEQVNVYKPKAKFDVDHLNACIGQDIAFFNKSDSGVSAYWEFGDGGVSYDYNAIHSYAYTGIFDVKMVVTDAHGCKDTLIKTAYIKLTKPSAAFTMSDSVAICHPHPVTFTNASGPNRTQLKHAWDFGNGTSILENPINVFGQPGYYTVRLIETDIVGCTDTAYGHVNVLGYAGAIQYSPLLGCKPLTVNFNANAVNIPSVIWDFNDGYTLKANSTTPVSHTYFTPGAYVPRIIFSDGVGCSSSSAGNDTIKVDGILPGFIHTPACEGYTVQFQDTSRGLFSPVKEWLWTFDDGKASAVNKPYHYYSKVGTYPVTLYVKNANGCKDTVNGFVNINPLPVVSAGSDTVICLSDAAQLQATGANIYTWDPPVNLSCNPCADPKASPVKKTEYTVVGTDINGCSDTDKVVVDIQLKTTSLAAEGGEICDDETIQLSASGAQSYVWTPAEDVNDNKIANPIASPHTTTNFRVVASEGSCIPDTNYVKVIVRPKPTVNASGEKTIIAGSPTPIDASGNLIRRFLWTPSESLTCSDCPSPFASPTKTTVYTVTAFTEYNCADSAKVTITVICDESQLFMPNTFTPNGDGMNDVFYPRGNGLDQIITFRVYNRWGEIVYERSNINLNDKQNGWDGTYKGQNLSPDVFVYIVEAQCGGGDVIKVKGDITLIR
jgi:gliding motility-associated-like protein